MADRSEMASSTGSLRVGNRTKPYVFSNKSVSRRRCAGPCLCEGCHSCSVSLTVSAARGWFFALLASLCHCNLWSRVAASMFLMVAREGNVKRNGSQEKEKVFDIETLSLDEGQWLKKEWLSGEECVMSRASELWAGRAVKSKRCQGQTRSRESGIIRKGCQQKEMKRWKRRSDKQQAPQGVVRKNSCQEKRKRSKRWRSQRLWQPGGQLRSYRLSLFFIDFIGFPPLETSVSRPWLYWYFVFHHAHTHTMLYICPDCNIEDSLSSNMRREIAENTWKYCAYAVFSAFGFRFFRVLGFGVLGF